VLKKGFRDCARLVLVLTASHSAASLPLPFLNLFKVVGNGASSQFSWKSASLDAGTRCYQGRQGFLAHVDSATSQNTVHRALYALTPSLEASSSSSSSSISSSSSAGAWVGALELASSADSSKEVCNGRSTKQWYEMLCAPRFTQLVLVAFPGPKWCFESVIYSVA
jgi:hypothetical protein